MTDFEAYQEYIQRKHNAFCKAVIRYANYLRGNTTKYEVHRNRKSEGFWL